jgi:hypothetical protein
MGDEPPGLAIRTGNATQLAEADRATAIAELLRVRDPATGDRPVSLGDSDRRRHYRETRLEPGDPVTIVGRALPFSDLADPVAADYGTEADRLDDDPEIAADLAEARAAGTLSLDPTTPGATPRSRFGIGRPVTTPSSTQRRIGCRWRRRGRGPRGGTFEIAPGTLVLAASAEVPLLIAYGTPGAVVERAFEFATGCWAPSSRSARRWCSPSCSRGRVVTLPSFAALFAVVLLVAIAGFIVLTSYNAVVALRQRSTRPGRISTSHSSSVTTSCPTSWRPSATSWPSNRAC